MRTLTRSMGDGLTLREAMDTLIQSSFVRPSWVAAYGQSYTPAFPVDVYEDGESYLIFGVLPGVDPQTVEITATGTTVAISAESKAPTSATGKPLLREITFGSYRRELTLPMDFDAENIAATYEHGLLKLIVPKAPKSRVHKVNVQVAR